MAIFTNVSEFGGNFNHALKSSFEIASSARIATGYVGHEMVNTYKSHFERIAINGGESKLLVGMAYFEGFTSEKTKNELLDLNEKLQKINSKNGVYVSCNGRYHGKIYELTQNASSNIFVGSSNFSSSGLFNNKECTILINDDDTILEVKSYLSHLFDSNNAALINLADIVSPMNKQTNADLQYKNYIKRLKKYDHNIYSAEDLQLAFKYPLVRATKPKSGINKYFARGRINKVSGIITPREWNEIEMIAPVEIINSPLYPKGQFTGFTNDGYIIPMKTAGQNFKNIESQGNLKLFGAWLKGKLESIGVLKRFEPLSEDSLIESGLKYVNFYKISETKYYIEF